MEQTIFPFSQLASGQTSLGHMAMGKGLRGKPSQPQHSPHRPRSVPSSSPAPPSAGSLQAPRPLGLQVSRQRGCPFQGYLHKISKLLKTQVLWKENYHLLCKFCAGAFMYSLYSSK